MLSIACVFVCRKENPSLVKDTLYQCVPYFNAFVSMYDTWRHMIKVNKSCEQLYTFVLHHLSQKTMQRKWWPKKSCTWKIGCFLFSWHSCYDQSSILKVRKAGFALRQSIGMSLIAKHGLAPAYITHHRGEEHTDIYHMTDLQHTTQFRRNVAPKGPRYFPQCREMHIARSWQCASPCQHMSRSQFSLIA